MSEGHIRLFASGESFGAWGCESGGDAGTISTVETGKHMGRVRTLMLWGTISFDIETTVPKRGMGRAAIGTLRLHSAGSRVVAGPAKNSRVGAGCSGTGARGMCSGGVRPFGVLPRVPVLGLTLAKDPAEVSISILIASDINVSGRMPTSGDNAAEGLRSGFEVATFRCNGRKVVKAECELHAFDSVRLRILTGFTVALLLGSASTQWSVGREGVSSAELSTSDPVLEELFGDSWIGKGRRDGIMKSELTSTCIVFD
ncbi:hypothetical protein BU15DRAFT_68551 [Melanogaster broomeanus]|nr:hypothetical protein BU15DRAFT_68551 [Melanogaster broomeanus]